MIEKLERYAQDGTPEPEGWMCYYRVARAREDALLEALKSVGDELPQGGWCFCPASHAGAKHTFDCAEANQLIREIERTR